MINISCDKLYLVTGGSGFLAYKLIEQLVKKGCKVRALARNEGNLVKLKSKFPQIQIYTGDISDKFVVKQSMVGVSGVFHLAASKHIGLSQKFVRETIFSNTLGSLNILEQSLTSPNIEFIIATSTDKAAQVSGVYGATKFLMQRLFRQYQSLNQNCQYRIVRYGNVLYSTGSVLCKWKELISKGKQVTVTDPEATRFFWDIEQAVDLIFDCLKFAQDSKPYYPIMKSMSVGNLLQAMISKYANGCPISIKVIGLQPGQNKHQKIMEDGQSSNEVEQFTIQEIMEKI